MMDELKRKQFNKEWVQIEASLSSQATNDDVRKWKIPSFPLANSVYDRPSMNGVIRFCVGLRGLFITLSVCFMTDS